MSRIGCAMRVRPASALFALGLIALTGHPLVAQVAIRTWQVTEVWRVDGTEGGREPLADPRDLAVTRDGTLWMLDFKDQQIRRFDANGKSLKAVGRTGSGPGEFRNANGLLVHSNGTVWVSDPLNARLSVFRSNGTLNRSITVSTWGWGFRWEGWEELLSGNVADPQPLKATGTAESQGWKLYAVDGREGKRLLRPSCSANVARTSHRIRAESKKPFMSMLAPYPFTLGGGAVANGRGAMWCATADSRSAVLVRIGRGDTLAKTSIDIPPVRIPGGERDSVVALLRTRISKYATNDFDVSRIPTVKPGISSLTVDDDGRLWVQHTHVFRETGPTFDVHDASGMLLGRLTLPRPMYGDGWVPLKARGDAMWVAIVDDDGVPSIARYRITR